MRTFSASEAVWPAMQRTYDYLFRPFQWRSYLKIAAVSVITEGIVVCLPITFPTELTSKISTSGADNLFDPWHIAFAVWSLLMVVTLLCIGLSIVTHLRFVFFDCLLHKTQKIREVWSSYSVSADRLFKANLLVWLADIGMFLLLGVVLAVVAYTVLNIHTSNGKLDPGVLLVMLFPSLGMAGCVCLLAVVFEVILHDFILPHMAMQQLSFAEAWKVVRQLILAEKETFLSYLILRLLLPSIAWVILAVIAYYLRWFFSQLLGLSVAEFEDLIDGTTQSSAYFRLAVDTGFITLGLGVWLSICVCLAAPVAVWTRYYAILFYGRPYRALREVAYPSGT
jgi:hypothetical protein